MGSINLSEFVTENRTFNYEDFKRTVRIAVNALNNVLDEGLPLHPLQEQRDCVRDWRQIGLGIFGLADMLTKMKIRYGSKDSINICDSIGQVMAFEAIIASNNIAEVKGSYPKYNKEAILKSEFLVKHTSSEEKIFKYGLHNSQLLTIPPTGTLSTMLGVSGGIEPIYANFYERKTESLHGHTETYKIYTPIVKKYMEENHLKNESELPDYFITAKQLSYKDRIDMQAIWQKHIDASISSTVNVPNDFSVEDTEKLYMYAWEKGLKGVTIFRDGCARAAVLSTSEEHVDEANNVVSVPDELPRGVIIKADDNCIGYKRTLHTGCGTLHCEAFFDPVSGELLETYLSKGSSGGCNQYMIGLSRMISLAARGGVNIYDIVDQLKSSGTCPSYAVRTATKHDTSKGNSCPVAVGNALIDMYNEIQMELNDIEENNAYRACDVKKENNIVLTSKIKCPECGNELTFEGGCNTCKNCGYSKCD